MSPRSGLTVAALAAFCALLYSCVDLEARASIALDGSGTLTLRYSVSRMAAPIASLEAGGGMLPFPLSREDFDLAVARAGEGGMSIASYARTDGADEVRVEAALAFASPKALAAFLDPAGNRAIYSEVDGKRSLRLVLSEGAALDPDAAKLVQTAFAANRVSIEVVLPSAAISPGIGSPSGRGERIQYSNTAAALLGSAQPVIWEIVW